VLAPVMDDDGLVGDDVFAHPTTKTVKTTTATGPNEDRIDIENSCVNSSVDLTDSSVPPAHVIPVESPTTAGNHIYCDVPADGLLG
jgi:hypothetical protein